MNFTVIGMVSVFGLQHVRDYPETRLIDRARDFAVDPSAISYAFKHWGTTVIKNNPATTSATTVNGKPS